MKMRKIIICALIAALCLTLIGCGRTGDEISPSSTPTGSEQANPDGGTENGEGDSGEAETAPVIAANLDSQLIGTWNFDTGTWIWFFGTSSIVEFIEDGSVTQVDTYDTGQWEVTGVGKMAVNDSQGGTFAFEYELNGDSLVIIDSDGDRATWVKEGGSRPVTESEDTGEMDNALVGRWEFEDGPYLYFFAQDSDIEFFSDGRIREYAHNETGNWHIDDSGTLIVEGEWSGRNEFTYEISGSNFDTLTITDEVNDSAVWKRAQ